MNYKIKELKVQGKNRICNIQIYAENNIELKNLELEPFDVVICDGPYGIVPPRDEVAGHICEWDSFVLNSKKGAEKFKDYYRRLFDICIPYIKDTASIFICGFPEGTSIIKNLLDKEYDLNFRRSISWIYDNHYNFDGEFNLHRSHETILYYTRTSKNFIFNGAGMRDVLEYPIITFDSCKFKDGAKPLEIPRFFLDIAACTGGRLLSLFAGFGTDLIVAAEYDMDSVGFEFNPVHVDMITDRLEVIV